MRGLTAFRALAEGGGTFLDHDHGWHMSVAERLAECAERGANLALALIPIPAKSHLIATFKRIGRDIEMRRET